MKPDYYELLFLRYPMPMWVFDNETLQILEVNEAAVQLYGYSRSEFLSKRITDIRPPEDIAYLLHRLKETENVPTKTGPWKHFAKNGSAFLVDVIWHPYEREGRPCRMVQVVDIEKQVQAKRELEVLQQQTRHILDSVADGILGIDSHSKILFVNRAAVEMFGWAEQAVLGQHLEDLIHETGSGPVVPGIESNPTVKTITEGLVIRREGVQFARSGGSPLPVDYVCAPIRSEEDTIIGAILTFRNMAEREYRSRFIEWETSILEFISSGRPLKQVMTSLAEGMETFLPGLKVSIAILDVDQQTINIEYAPSITEGYVQWMNGQVVTHALGACGASILRKELVWVESIPKDPEWDSRGKEKAIASGLLACWSFPILDATGAALGSLSLYSDSERGPTPAELDALTRSAHILAVAIERNRKVHELKASEARFRSLYHNAASGIAILNKEGVVEEANDALLRIFGSQHAVIGSKLEDWVMPEDVGDLKGRLNSLEADPSQSIVTEFRIRNTEMNLVWLRADISILDSEDVKQEGEIILVVSNITDIHRINEELRLLSHSVDQLKEIVLITDAGIVSRNGPKIVFVNQAFETITGYSRDETIGNTPKMLQGPGTSDVTRMEIRQALEAGLPVEAEILNYSKSGQAYWIELSIRPVINVLGEITHFIGVERDVTEERADRIRILEQAELLDNTHDAIFVCSSNGTITFWNSGAEKLYGWSREEVVGKSSPLPLEESIRKMGTNDRWSGEERMKDRYGSEYAILSSLTRIGNQHRSIIFIHSDITQSKKIEEQFLRSQRMDSLGNLAGGMAHDLNNLLSPIIMGVGLLRSQNLDSSSRSVLREIEMSARRGADLVKQVLTFARGTSGERKEIRWAGIVNELETLIRTTFPKNIRLQIDLPEKLWPVKGDPTQIYQVLLNLLVNARDAMPKGGRLRLIWSNEQMDEIQAAGSLDLKPGRYVRITVEDEGAGIPPELREHLFEPFFTTKVRGQGTGLGLPTALGIVRSHGGALHYESKEGSSTAFEVFLPVQPDQQIAGTPAHAVEVETAELLSEESASSGLPGGYVGNGEQILLVDDEASILHVTANALESSGYSVLTAVDGAVAISQFGQHLDEIQLVITDLVMPVMDGFSLIAALKRLSPDTPVIAVSGETSHGERLLREIGDNGLFLLKPYRRMDLLKLIYSSLKRSHEKDTDNR